MPQWMTADCSSTSSLFGSKLISSKKLPHVSVNVISPLSGTAASGFCTGGAELQTAHLPLAQDCIFVLKKKNSGKCKGK